MQVNDPHKLTKLRLINIGMLELDGRPMVAFLVGPFPKPAKILKRKTLKATKPPPVVPASGVVYISPADVDRLVNIIHASKTLADNAR